MIEAMSRWPDYDGFPSWNTACARVGYNPKRLRMVYAEETGWEVFVDFGGGKGENPCGAIRNQIHVMLLQTNRMENRRYCIALTGNSFGLRPGLCSGT
jgi:hypothetical protein